MSEEPTTAVAEFRAPASSLIEVISRAAADPSINIEKLQQLLAMHERIAERQAETDYDEAMNAAQTEMRAIATDANNPQTHSKYASYGALDKALRPIYTRHGFALSFFQGDGAPEGFIRISCRVSRGGHKETPHLDMPADGKGAKGGDVMTKTHATGAAITYGRRYLLGMIFNIAVGEDLDGNDPQPKEMGEAAKHAIAEINGCETAAALVEWKAKKSKGVAAIVTAAELREIIALFNRRVEAFKSEEVV
jgi:hypothetical protein